MTAICRTRKSQGGVIVNSARVARRDDVAGVSVRLLTSLVLALGVALLATPADSAPHDKFSHADFNKDKRLTRAEACAGRTPDFCRYFYAMDRNGDGVVSRSEARDLKHALKRRGKDKPRKD